MLNQVRCISCRPGHLGKYCNQPDSNQPDTTFPIANARDKQPRSDDDASDTVHEQPVICLKFLRVSGRNFARETVRLFQLYYYIDSSAMESFAESSDDFGTLRPPSALSVHGLRGWSAFWAQPV